MPQADLSLSTNWSARRGSYDFIVIGSGYGGAVAAARLAAAPLNPKPSVCVLERGREWRVGTFPDNLAQGLAQQRSSANALGLYELLDYRDISVIKGSGLGGTSLVNANVAIAPDPDVFELSPWPRTLTWEELKPHFDAARAMLAATPHPRAAQLRKVQALHRRAQQIGQAAEPLDLAVNFTIQGINAHGMMQAPCTDCGDCVSGCNTGAKNTLYMNYLPAARRAGAEIFTQVKVEWIEKLPGGGWRVHGRYYRNPTRSEKFQMEARNVILAAGSINSTEILLRSEARGLRLSPRIGSAFGGNGDFFGLSYNGDFPTNVLGFGNRPNHPRAASAPGPTIVAAVRYNRNRPLLERITIEDLSFPSAYTEAAKLAFAALRGVDTDVGDEAEERRRREIDLNPFQRDNPNGALNHTMLYLCMGFDDAQGKIVFEAPWFERDGRVRVEWPEVGKQGVFQRINEELRRHTRAQGGSFIENPLWAMFNRRRLITAHPLGGCPMGEDYLQGAVDEFGRVFAGDGSIHEGLFVTDGAVIPTSLGVNPFLTITALAERMVSRKVQQMQGVAYPAPPTSVSFAQFRAEDAIAMREGELERIFRNAVTLGIETMVNTGERSIDVSSGRIVNDTAWKGFFPKGHVLNALSAAVFTGFQKQFSRQGRKYVGVTSDTDGRIRARNSLEEVEITRRTGDLEPGKYILLRYLDPPWQGFYDIFKVINKDLLIGRVYLGSYPHGIRQFTFPMTRVYTLAQMSVADHRALWEQGTVPTKETLHGVWRMDAISNANHFGAVAYLTFSHKPDGRLESRYQFLGLMEGLVMPSFLPTHFQLHDFTPFHDEIRQVTPDLMVGKYVVNLPAGVGDLLPANSLGILHLEESGGRRRFGFYYVIERVENSGFPHTPLLAPFLNVQLPAGVGMTFDEEMVGWYFPGQPVSTPGREGDLEIARRIPASGAPEGAVSCRFQLRMTVDDLNEFLDGVAHEARAQGSISFGDFDGQGPATFPVDPRHSFFNYLRVNPETGEAEMCYRLVFATPQGKRYLFDGRKYMQKDLGGGIRGMQEALADFTTLYVHVYELDEAGAPGAETGTGYLKFRTFEDLAALGNLMGFLRSFRVTGTSDLTMQLRAQMKFLAFTAQFVQIEYDPLSPDSGSLREDVRAEVLRGADTPDYFSTRPTVDLHSVLRNTPTLPLESLLNRGRVTIDFDRRRIFRDSFWKGSFAEDTKLGWKERLLATATRAELARAGEIFAGGGFWKRFDRIENGVAVGHVVNYELSLLPGKPEVREVVYPNNDRRYFTQGQKILLLRYTNHPYRLVYDTIKVIDENNALGVMHLGDFPNGFEFAAFVMARHNYPFEKMSLADHRLIFDDPRVQPVPRDVLTGNWDGHLIWLANPDLSLKNRANPVLFRLEVRDDGARQTATLRWGALSETAQVEWSDALTEHGIEELAGKKIRMIDRDTLIGHWSALDSRLLLWPRLAGYIEPLAEGAQFSFLITRGR